MNEDANLYNRVLYRSSERFRLQAINRGRRKRGMSEVTSLADVKLRVEHDNASA